MRARGRMRPGSAIRRSQRAGFERFHSGKSIGVSIGWPATAGCMREVADRAGVGELRLAGARFRCSALSSIMSWMRSRELRARSLSEVFRSMARPPVNLRIASEITLSLEETAPAARPPAPQRLRAISTRFSLFVPEVRGSGVVWPTGKNRECASDTLRACCSPGLTRSPRLRLRDRARSTAYPCSRAPLLLRHDGRLAHAVNRVQDTLHVFGINIQPVGRNNHFLLTAENL